MPYKGIAQTELDSLEIAEAYLENENFNSAIKFYKRFLKEMPNDPELNFKMGFSLLNTANGKEESIEYFKKAQKKYSKKRRRNKVKYIESSFYLARAYRSSYQFEEAEKEFKALRKKLKNKYIISEIDKELNLCENGKLLVSNPKNILLENLGDTINSNFSDHSPVISADESTLIFTSRRQNNSGGEGDMDGQYDEDIFISKKDENGNWTIPVSISKNINTPDHEASIGLSVDGQILFIYKPEDEGSIYTSELHGSRWGMPKKLGPNINTKYRETHASLSTDGKKIYFASDRPGGLGGLDIYVSEKQPDGNWGKAINLGDAINTKYNEDSPFIHPNGKTLYFSSKGHTNLGGYDVFISEKNEFGTFKKAQNIGYPVNTVQDDIFYLPTADGKRAYFASKRKGGKGSNDLYLVDNKSAAGSNISVMTGKLYTDNTNEDLPKSKITLTNIITNEKWYYKPNTKNGKYILVVDKGQSYNFELNINKITVFKDIIIVPQDAPYQMKYKDIYVDPKKKRDITPQK